LWARLKKEKVLYTSITSLSLNQNEIFFLAFVRRVDWRDPSSFPFFSFGSPFLFLREMSLAIFFPIRRIRQDFVFDASVSVVERKSSES
jgi:hypothetical protein